jgi:outer membrane immunogenic protein
MSRLLAVLASASLLTGIVQTASAADMPLKSPPRVTPYSWTGFYIGAHLGGGWGTSSTVLAAIPTIGLPAGFPLSTTHPRGILGGGQIGANWQSDKFVFGVQGDFSGANLTDTVPCTLLGNPFTCSDKTNWLATVSARLGVVINERFLAYVKGGAAWEHAKYSLNDPLGVVFPAGSSFSSTDTRLGWLVGGGGEYAFTNNWSVFVEYNYLDFGSRNESSFIPAPVGAIVTGSLTDKIHVVKGGLNYKF